MQPCEALSPSEAMSSVPWIPWPSKKPIQRALRGLSGSPGGIVCPASSPAQALLGTCHAGVDLLVLDLVAPGFRIEAGLPEATAPLQGLEARAQVPDR